MPVKVRCPGCQKVLNAPDAARGKAVKCPACATKIKVPGGDGAAAARAATARPGSTRRAAARQGGDDDFLAGLDLRSIEDRKNRVCPRCGAAVTEEDIDCPKCYVNLQTGVLNEAMSRKLTRKGPDPAEFYSTAWGDCWRFLMTNKQLAVKTGLSWSLFMVLSISCFLIAGWCEGGPTKAFWGALGVLWSLGIGGWYWFISQEVIEATMQSRKIKRLKDINFDFMTNVALGVKSQLWPIWLVHTLPPLIVLLPLVFPLALIHMTRRYTYKAWIGWEMLLITVKNFLPSAYWVLMSVVINVIPNALVIGWGMLAWMVFQRFEDPVATWTLGLIDAKLDEPGFFGWIIFGALRLVWITAGVFPIGLIMAFPAIYMTRANGLLAYYFRKSLDLVDEQTAGVPCGFWVRYIAFSIDILLYPLATILVWKNRTASLIGWLINIVTFAVWWFVPQMLPLVGSLLTGPYYNWMYFSLQEGSHDRATVGKQALGVVVTDMEGNQLTEKRASGRWAGKFFLSIGGLSYVLAAFTPQKQALHDMLAKTLVVWRGDDEATTR